MSAITGIFYRNGKTVEYDQIKKVNNILSHRGPDGSKIWNEGSMALGHQMLYTTPESLHEILPFEDNDLVITSDSRIDNRKELSEKLNLKNNTEVSDSYFILKAYEKWGEKCPKKLLGDFTFAIWDKYNQKLFCARDHMGIKPFYYYLSNDLFIFATEIKAIFTILGIKREINELQMAYHLTVKITENREMTFYENIFRLPAAHSLTINKNNFNLNKYWKLNPDNKINLNSDEEYEKAFRDIFTESVNCRSRSAYPIGSMLSGGLDSSSVSCVAQKILQTKSKKKLKTFSAIFEDVPESNEYNFIKKVLSENNFESYFINADKISVLKELTQFFKYSDHPLIVPNTFMIWNIYREANKKGARIVLDGIEGDEIVYSDTILNLKELLLSLKLIKFFKEIESLYRNRSLPYKYIIYYLSLDLAPLLLIKIIKKIRQIYYNPEIINKNFSQQTNISEKNNQFIKKNQRIKTVNEKHYNDIDSAFIQFKMELNDWISAPFSTEARHPFYDKRLVEFCLALPSEQKVSKGWDRYIMRRALKNIIPREIQWRNDKGDLSYNFNNSLLKEDKEIQKLIYSKNNQFKEYIDMENLRRIYNRFKSGKVNVHMYIWNAILILKWLEKDLN